MSTSIIPVSRLISLCLLLAVTAGCSSFSQRDQMALFNAAYDKGDYGDAAVAMGLDDDASKAPQGKVLELLHQGEALRLEGNYTQSIAVYDRAENGMKYLDQEGFAATASEDVMSVLVNDSTRDYRALMSEAILVNTYKALSFLALGDNANARVEFNRADDRTRRAVDYFADEIAEQRRALQKDPANARAVQQNINSDGIQGVLRSKYGDPAGWSVYPRFIVPSSTYLHGLYFLASGEGSSDFERAATSLKRVAQMAPNNPTIAADAELAEALASGQQTRQSLPPMVWLVYENGLGPVLQEIRFDIPLFLSHGDWASVVYTGIALPRYTDRTPVGGALVVTSDDGTRYNTQLVASMGKVIRTEMQERFTSILARSISSAVVKGIFQHEATESLGAAGQLGSILYTIATTQADLRGWQAMPDHWEATRFERPANGVLELNDSQQGALGHLALPNWPYTLVYLKRPTVQSPATVMVLDLQGQHPGQRFTLPEVGEP
ncbi:COG3014 family protein [Marinobacter sp. 1Y8]